MPIHPRPEGRGFPADQVKKKKYYLKQIHARYDYGALMKIELLAKQRLSKMDSYNHLANPFWINF